MSALRKGIVLAILQVLIVVSLGIKLLIDRARYPRVWALSVVYDPDMPIRGRYLSLRLEVNASRIYGPAPDNPSELGNVWAEQKDIWLSVENGQLVANPLDHGSGIHVTRWWSGAQKKTLTVLQEPVVYFIPEDAQNPSILKPGEELWVEVTVPKRGPPRPIRLGIKKGDVLTPLTLD